MMHVYRGDLAQFTRLLSLHAPTLEVDQDQRRRGLVPETETNASNSRETISIWVVDKGSHGRPERRVDTS